MWTLVSDSVRYTRKILEGGSSTCWGTNPGQVQRKIYPWVDILSGNCGTRLLATVKALQALHLQISPVHKIVVGVADVI